MKKLILHTLIILTLHLENAYSQAGEWTFMKGDSIGASPGVYGTQGVPSMANTPPAFYEACEWTDLQGNFWLYGGLNWGIGGSYTSAMWKYEPATNMWTWMQGSNLYSQPPVFGIQGVPSPLNTPGNRAFGGSTFTDTSGNLWLIFGYCSPGGEYNTLWKYDTGTNEWTWMSGTNVANSPGQYGIQGIPSVNNCPPGRSESVTAWVDSQNNFWTFGGISGIGGGSMNDLWRYTPATNEWTWMNGSSTALAPSVYGIKGVASATNMPGARASYSKWQDSQDNLWFFGGTIGVAGQRYSDLWKYDISTNQFTWMSGASVLGSNGYYGPLCVADTGFYPSARGENKACWTDDCDNFWMMGGTVGMYRSDLWQYNTTTNEWMLAYGSAAVDTGIYGIMGVSSPLNRPPSRNGTSSWKDLNGNLWMYGGYVSRLPYNCMNDLWRYVPDPACGGCASALPSALFTANNHICPGTCIDFTNLSVNATAYQWSFSGASPSSSTDINPVSVCYSTPGTYDVTLIATNANGSDTLTLANYITVFPYPAPQGITQSGDTLFAVPGAISYQWYHDGNLVAGATDYYYIASGGGDYNVVATDNNGCEVEAAIFDVIADVSMILQEAGISVFPNPAAGDLGIRYPGCQGQIPQVSIYNPAGELALKTDPVNLRQKGQTLFVDVSALPSGLYLVRVSCEGHTFLKKVQIRHLE